MPYVISTTVATIGGASHARGHVVSDKRGEEILAEHPSAANRIAHDDDLCAQMVDTDCVHESHAWSKPAPAAPAAPAVVSPPVSSPALAAKDL